MKDDTAVIPLLLYITIKQLAAAFNVCENTVLQWERDGLIHSVRLPAQPGSKKPPKRFYVDDVKALARHFRFREERAS